MFRALPLLLLVCAMPAQAVLRVGPTRPFPDIQAAINAGQPGDVVLIDAGSYPGFTLTQEMTLRTAQAAGTVTVTSVTLTLTGTANAVLDGLSCTGGASATGPAGVITCNACNFDNGFWATNANVHLIGCRLQAQFSGGAFDATGSTRLAAVQSTFRGLQSPFAPTHGIQAQQQATIQLSHCTVNGGIVWGLHNFAPGAGILLRDTARAWVSDSSVSGFTITPSPVNPSFAIDNQSSLPVIVDRSSLVAGNNSFPATSGTVQNGFLLGVSSLSQLTLGSPFQLDFRTRPGLPVVVHGSLRIGPPVTLPVIAQPEWGFASNSIALLVLVGDTFGAASMTVQVPNVPAFAHVGVWFLAWSEQNLPLQLCPPIGGVIR